MYGVQWCDRGSGGRRVQEASSSLHWLKAFPAPLFRHIPEKYPDQGRVMNTRFRKQYLQSRECTPNSRWWENILFFNENNGTSDQIATGNCSGHGNDCRYRIPDPSFRGKYYLDSAGIFFYRRTSMRLLHSLSTIKTRCTAQFILVHGAEVHVR